MMSRMDIPGKEISVCPKMLKLIPLRGFLAGSNWCHVRKQCPNKPTVPQHSNNETHFLMEFKTC